MIMLRGNINSCRFLLYNILSSREFDVPLQAYEQTDI